MRTFGAAFTEKLLAESAFFTTLFRIGLSTPIYYNSSDIDLYYDTNLYYSADVTFDSIDVSSFTSADNVTLTFGNAGLTLSALLLGEDARNKEVILTIVAINDNLRVIAAEQFFTGFIDTWNIDEKRAKITIVNEFVFWNKKVLRVQAASCPWDFVTDGTGECAYSGSATWCDKSHNRCTELANTANFGGFRFLPIISEKEIWWGRKPA